MHSKETNEGGKVGESLEGFFYKTDKDNVESLIWSLSFYFLMNHIKDIFLLILRDIVNYWI